MKDSTLQQSDPVAAPSVQEAITLACVEFADRVLYNAALPGGRWAHTSYGEFMTASQCVLSALRGMGILPGDRVALIAANSPLWTEAYTAILLAGAVAVPLDERLTLGEVKNIIADSETSLIFYDDDTKEAALASGAESAIELDSLDFEAFAPDMDIHLGRRADTACLLYTSGTTGSPKAVVLNHDNLLSDADALFRAGIVNSTDNLLSVLPLHHTYAFMCTFLAPVLLGAQITIPEALKGPAIVTASVEKGVTIIPAVPQLLSLFNNRARERINSMRWPLRPLMTGAVTLSGAIRNFTGLNLMGMIRKPLGRQFRFFTSGGARLEPRLLLDLEALGLTVLEGYGLTETAPIAAFNPPGMRKPGSVGLPVHSAEIRIISKEGAEEGEIAIRGPMVTGGYYNRDAENAASFRDGWFLSGDLGYIDDDGYLFLTGRKKEVIVLGSGKNVYPEEVESMYLSCPLISEICVYEEEGRLKAIVVPDYQYMKLNSIANAGEAMRWEVEAISRKLAPHNRIMGYTLRSEPLPRTPLGKLRRFMVKQQAEEDSAPDITDDGSMNVDSPGRRVAGILSNALARKRPVRVSDNLELDLGIDSLKRVELSVALEREFTITMPEGFMAGMHTAGELADGIRALLSGYGSYGDKADKGLGLDAVLQRTPTDGELAETGFKPSFLDKPITKTGLVLVKVISSLYFRLGVKGEDNLPEPPYIIAPNHSSYLDAFVLGAALPTKVFNHAHFIGIERFFRGRLARHFARLAHVIPIDPDAHLGKALSLSAHCLRSGSPLIIFPEGGCSSDGELLPFRPGIGILATKLGIPVVPVRIEGTFKAMPKWKSFPVPKKVTVTFGEPVAPTKKAGKPQGFQTFTDIVRERIRSLGS